MPPRRPQRARKKTPPSQGARPGAPGQLLGTHNKAPDVFDDDAAALQGWLGERYRFPPGPPYPWDGLLPDERAVFDRAVERLTLVLVPRRIALALCWGDGAWRPVCAKIVDALNVECYPARKHIRLIPRPTIRQVLGLPEPHRGPLAQN
jgi:hypothetical protein